MQKVCICHVPLKPNINSSGDESGKVIIIIIIILIQFIGHCNDNHTDYTVYID